MADIKKPTRSGIEDFRKQKKKKRQENEIHSKVNIEKFPSDSHTGIASLTILDWI